MKRVISVLMVSLFLAPVLTGCSGCHKHHHGHGKHEHKVERECGDK